MKYQSIAVLAFLAVASASHVKLTEYEQCDFGTECPGGCCPYVGWYCCPDGMYCAATAADCPFIAQKALLTQMAANKQCDGTECPFGCCPFEGWQCCSDGISCASGSCWLLNWICVSTTNICQPTSFEKYNFVLKR